MQSKMMVPAFPGRIPMVHMIKYFKKLQIVIRNYTNQNLLKLHERGLLEDFFPNASNELQTLLSKRQCLYGGFDPTADSLHIGNLVVLMTLLHGQRGGHEVIAMIGGATALVGDPSGHNSERLPLETSFVEKNAEGIRSCLHRIFKNHECHFWHDPTGNSPLIPLRILNNIVWYRALSVVDFMSTYGRRFRLADMLSKQSVKSRLNSPEGMNFAEFSYQAFQAYDWLHLFDKYQCRIQVGGGDQMGNIYAGHDLVKKTRAEQVYGLLGPLVTSESGDKLGKSAGNTVWLDSAKTSPFELYQYFFRVADTEVVMYLKMFTFLSLAEIKQLSAEHSKYPDQRKAQKKLAQLVVLLIHGEDGLKSALRTTNILYNAKPDDLARLSEEEMVEIFKQATSAHLRFRTDMTILQMVMEAKCFPREEDALRIFDAGGLYVNHQKVVNPSHVLVPEVHILPTNFSVIRVGKKNYYLVKWLT